MEHKCVRKKDLILVTSTLVSASLLFLICICTIFVKKSKSGFSSNNAVYSAYWVGNIVNRCDINWAALRRIDSFGDLMSFFNDGKIVLAIISLGFAYVYIIYTYACIEWGTNGNMNYYDVIFTKKYRIL